MLTKSRYSIKDLIKWTRFETFFFILFSGAVTASYYYFDLSHSSLPWTPIALIGTAVAFMVGFQNNSAYGRIWEARKIWGGIVNTSRTWGMKSRDMISNDYATEELADDQLQKELKELIKRHIAWMTALRHALRGNKKWEVNEKLKTNREWMDNTFIPERVTSLEDDLTIYLTKEELSYTLKKSNKASALLYLQSKHIKKLKDSGYIWEFSFLELENLLQEMFTLQGKAERIKNFPYPRQYATLSYYFVRIFIFLLPFGLVPEFSRTSVDLVENLPYIAPYFIWAAIPFCSCVSWIFYTMERIGRVGENPFEGSPNDVPISTIARGIEIDLYQLLDEDINEIPCQFPEYKDVQM